jgi:squalene synthase HpnC
VSAFDQDIDSAPFADRAALLDHCRRAVNPAGQLLLHLLGMAAPDNLADADAICTSLQLINFWQDVAVDGQKGRLYLPLADLERFGVTEAQIVNGVVDDAWRALMADEISYARAMLVRSAPLALRIPGRLGIELCGVVHGALRIAERIEKADYDVFRHRPVLNGFDWCVVSVRTVAMWLSRRVGVRVSSVEGNA